MRSSVNYLIKQQLFALQQIKCRLSGLNKEKISLLLQVLKSCEKGNANFELSKATHEAAKQFYEYI